MTPEDLKIIRLDSGEQIACYLLHEPESKFIRIIEPLEIRTHTEVGDYGVVNDHLSLVEWITNSKDNTFSIHRDRLVTIARADNSLIEYYSYTRKNFDKIKREKEAERKVKSNIRKLENSLKDGKEKYTRKDLIDILTGNVTKH